MRPALAAALLLAGCSQRPLQNYRACLKLRVGMARADVLQRLGPPDETQPYVEGKSLPNMRGRTAYEWATPASMPAPNRVVVDDASGLVETIRCGDAQISAEVLKEPAPSTAAPASPLFTGHYGYAFRYADGSAVRSAFARDGASERVLVLPPGCSGSGPCAAEAFTVLVVPKWLAARQGFPTLDAYVLRVSSALAKEAPAAPAPRPAPFPARVVTRAKAAGPLDATTFLEGSKVYYLFDHAASGAAARAAIDSLSEPSPNDRPPAAAGAPQDPGTGIRAGSPIGGP